MLPADLPAWIEGWRERVKNELSLPALKDNQGVD
jgi:hypothetical protein